MVEEPCVLDGDDRLAHDGRHRAEGHLDAVLVVDRREYGSVGGQDDRALRELGCVELVGEALEALHGTAGDETRSGGKRKDHGGHDRPGRDGDDEESHEADQGPEGPPSARGAFPHECSFLAGPT